MKTVLKHLLLFFFLFLTTTLEAEETIPYLFIQNNDNEIYEIKLSEEFAIQHHSGDIEIISENEETISIPLNSVSLLGFLYKEMEKSNEVNSLLNNPIKEIWQIYDIEGRFIRETYSNSPDLNNLPVGKFFIIKSASSSFKYIPYK